MHSKLAPPAFSSPFSPGNFKMVVAMRTISVSNQIAVPHATPVNTAELDMLVSFGDFRSQTSVLALRVVVENQTVESRSVRQW
ncbi:hypothetical protein CLCR_11097 [Cladophialophora carrionii]|uniref:Uncharacterized protein n=1 Tax=Cladophialophora carrionii TaxID=86049 RepID=A0A1C1CW65_9EURO|nr:hypothetical protein CLCR_11097 [Cladophialophora carrionii]